MTPSPQPTVLMGDPAFFVIKSGSNPHTRTRLGFRKKVDQKKAIQQWRGLAEKLTELGVQVLVMPGVPEWPGTVFTANAGFLLGCVFYLSNLTAGRTGERRHYQNSLEKLGFVTREVPYRFEGEADFFPAGEGYLLTYGRLVKRQRFIFHLGIPPWKRLYGFRTDQRNLEFLKSLVAPKPIETIQLMDEAHYHGDTLLCSFGPQRRFLLGYLSKIHPSQAKRLQREFGNDLVELEPPEGDKFAANSFYTETEKGKFLVIPAGLRGSFISQIQAKGVVPISVDVSEFMQKGGGSVKCMVCDLGKMDLDDPKQPEEVRRFRRERLYR